METDVLALLCRTSDRGPGCARGAAALAPLLGDARVVAGGDPPRDGRWDDDLRDAAACLREAGRSAEDALAAGRFPVTCAGDCTISIATLPAVARQRPSARIVWLDAHGDFHTPATTPSGFLGGMCLAGGCGLWPMGFAGAVDPALVVLAGARDLEPDEEAALDAAGVLRLDAAERIADAIAGDEVYVHLDLDVLDPSVMPAQFPAPGGWKLPELQRTLELVAAAGAGVIGAEITCLDAPADDGQLAELAEAVATAVAPLLPAARAGS